MVWVMIVTMLWMGLLLYFTPNMSRATVPLGVNVPSDRIADPVVRVALRRFRIACVAVTAVAILGAWLTRTSPAAAVLWLVAQVAAVIAAYTTCRRPIQLAKRSGNWYQDAQVRVGAEVLGTARHERPVWVAHGLALALSLGGVIALVIGYDSLPSRYPTHWNFGGHADSWAAKSWLTVLAPAVVAVILALLVALLGWVLSRRHDPLLPDGNPQAAERLRRASDRLIQTTLGLVNVIVTAIATLTALAPLLGLSGAVLAVCIWLGVGALVVGVGWIVALAVRAQSRLRADAVGVTRGPQSPDDDRLWKLGVIYYNRDDPSLMVPKRSGFGFTINAGHPAGMAFFVAVIVLLALAVVLPVLA